MKQVEEMLDRVISEPNVKVATLHGAWGVGKTFFWKEYVKNCQNVDRRYAYASLFGLKNVDEIKAKIFESIITPQPEGDFAKKAVGQISSFLHSVSTFAGDAKVKGIPTKVVAGAIQNLALKDLLICLDDLERKDPKLELGSVLGLISELAEQRNCKIVLIYNPITLDDKDKKKYDEFREKVIDLEVLYNPEIRANLEIIWPDGVPEYVADVFIKTGVNNIRVMGKVQSLLAFVDSKLKPDYEPIKNRIFKQATKLAVLHYSFAADFTLDELTEQGYYTIFLDKTGEKRKRFKPALACDFGPSDYDPMFVSFLRNGWVDVGAYATVFEKDLKDSAYNKISGDFEALWRRYYGNFILTEKEFIDGLEDFVQNHYDKIGPANVLDAIQVVKKSRPSFDEKPVIEKLVKHCAAFKNISPMVRSRLHNEYPDIWKQIQELADSQIEKRSDLMGLLTELAGSNSWDSADVKYFQPFSEDELFEWVRSEESNELIPFLAEFFDRFEGHSQATEAIAKLKRAVKRVAAGSEFNSYRIKKMGLDDERKESNPETEVEEPTEE